MSDVQCCADMALVGGFLQVADRAHSISLLLLEDITPATSPSIRQRLGAAMTTRVGIEALPGGE